MEICNIKTYPQYLINILNNNKKSLEKYFIIENERMNIKNKYKGQEYINAINEENNFYNNEKHKLIYSIYIYVKHKIKYYIYINKQEFKLIHFTRLMDYEIEEIKKNGMRILNNNLIKEKIYNLYKNKIINLREYNILLNKIKNFINYNQDNVNSNFNRIFFSNYDYGHMENNINQLIQKWGGEFIYRRYDDDKNYNKNSLEIKLTRISKPYIIIINIPYYRFYTLQDIEANIIEFFITKKCFGFEVSVYKNISNKFIYNILKKEDREFEKITEYKNWKEGKL